MGTGARLGVGVGWDETFGLKCRREEEARTSCLFVYNYINKQPSPYFNEFLKLNPGNTSKQAYGLVYLLPRNQST